MKVQRVHIRGRALHRSSLVRANILRRSVQPAKIAAHFQERRVQARRDSSRGCRGTRKRNARLERESDVNSTSVHISRALSSSMCPHKREPRSRWKQKRRKRLVSGECRPGRSGRCLPGHARIFSAEEPFLWLARTQRPPAEMNSSPRSSSGLPLEDQQSSGR